MASSKAVRLSGIAMQRQTSRMATTSIQGIRRRRVRALEAAVRDRHRLRTHPQFDMESKRQSHRGDFKFDALRRRCFRAACFVLALRARHCEYIHAPRLGSPGLSCPGPSTEKGLTRTSTAVRRSSSTASQRCIDVSLSRLLECRFSATGATWKSGQTAFAGASDAEEGALSCQVSRLKASIHPFSR